MDWNYGVTKQRVKSLHGYDFEFAIREVYYNDDGSVRCWTDKPAVISNYTSEEHGTAGPLTITGESDEINIKGLRWVLRRMLEATKKPIIDIPADDDTDEIRESDHELA